MEQGTTTGPGRWGESTPEIDEIWAFPGTWADATHGVQIDWSGVTAVLVCLHPGCGVQFGPVMNLEDVPEASRHHREGYHAKAITRNGHTRIETGVTPESKAAARAMKTCWNCQKVVRGRLSTRGVCTTCRRTVAPAWAIELGYLPEGSQMADLLALVKRLRTEANQPAPPQGPTPIHGNRKLQKRAQLPYKANHGTRKGYKAGCRCHDCAEVQSAYAAEARRKRLERGAA